MSSGDLKSDFIRYGDRQSLQAAKLAAEIKACENELKTMEKSDLRENFDYNAQVDKLKTLYFRAAKYKHWQDVYNNFRPKLLSSETKHTDTIDVGSIVKYNIDGKEMKILLVPEHIGNRAILAISIDSPIGITIRGKTVGFKGTVIGKKKTIVIEEVL